MPCSYSCQPQNLSHSGPNNTPFTYYGSYQFHRGHIEGRVIHRNPFRKQLPAAQGGKLLPAPLLYLDGGSPGGSPVEGGQRGDYVKWHTGGGGRKGQGIGPYLVCGISVHGHPVRPGDHSVHRTGTQEGCRSGIGDDSYRYPRPGQFPGGKPGPLEKGSGLVGENALELTLFMGFVNHRQGGSQTGGGQAAGVQ